jgi:hypothetical protein
MRLVVTWTDGRNGDWVWGPDQRGKLSTRLAGREDMDGMERMERMESMGDGWVMWCISIFATA